MITPLRDMKQQRFKHICPVCGKDNLKFLSQHLSSVHKLSSTERKPYLKKAMYQGITVYNESLPVVHVSPSLPKKK